MSAPDNTMKKRLNIALIVIAAIYAALIVRLAYIQLVQGNELEQKAESQQTKNTTLSATRGLILDSTGEVLARNGTAYKIVIWPQSIKASERKRVATELAELIGRDYETVLERISDTSKQEIILARQVERETVDAINALKLGNGVGTAIDTKRYYTNGSLFSQLLGFTTVDGIGQAGLEQTLESYLAGTDGEMVTETDRKGNPLAYGMQEIIEAEDGCNVTLTTNAVIQEMLEEACAEALEVNKAASVQGIVMRCTTGEIVAETIQPDYDPNNPPRSDMSVLTSLMRNRVVTDAYEPGSTFKLVTLASAIDSGTVTLDNSYHCSGSTIVDGGKIKCWKSGGHGDVDVIKATEGSCNVAFVDMALSMGTETFYDYLCRFGFGSGTGCGISGESSGIVINQKYITPATLARIGFGQSIAVTPVQLCNAVCAIVNGGNLMQPYIIDSIDKPDGTTVVDNEPKLLRRVISEQTSDIVRSIAESVVANGSGKNASVAGYRIGGKTGTAQKYENGSIANGKLVASFIGFAPADDPEYVCLILVDEPQVGSIFGSTVAAPFVGEVLGEILKYDGYLPVNNDETETVPELRGMTIEEARDALRELGLSAVFQDEETEVVTAQVPQAGTSVVKDSGVLLYTAITSARNGEGTGDGLNEMVEVPNLIRKNKLEAADALKEKGLVILIDPPDQTGTVIRQSPEAGTLVEYGSKVLAEFSNTKIGD